MAREVTQIASEAEYDAALDEIEKFFDLEPAVGTPEAARFDALAEAVNAYEQRVWPIEEFSAGSKMRSARSASPRKSVG